MCSPCTDAASTETLSGADYAGNAWYDNRSEPHRLCHRMEYWWNAKSRTDLPAITSESGSPGVRPLGTLGEAMPTSDLDLLVDLEPGRGMVDLGALLAELKAELGALVDVVTQAGRGHRGERGCRPTVGQGSGWTSDRPS